MSFTNQESKLGHEDFLVPRCARSAGTGLGTEPELQNFCTLGSLGSLNRSFRPPKNLPSPPGSLRSPFALDKEPTPEPPRPRVHASTCRTEEVGKAKSGGSTPSTPSTVGARGRYDTRRRARHAAPGAVAVAALENWSPDGVCHDSSVCQKIDIL